MSWGMQPELIGAYDGDVIAMVTTGFHQGERRNHTIPKPFFIDLATRFFIP